MIQNVTLGQLITTADLGPDSVVAGRGALGRRVTDVRLARSGSLSAVHGGEGHLLVLLDEPNVYLELNLERVRASGAVGIVVNGDLDGLPYSTLWLADRLDVAIVVTQVDNVLELAVDLERAVHATDISTGLACAAVSRRLGGLSCSPERAVAVLGSELGVDSAVMTNDAAVLAGSTFADLTARFDWLSPQTHRRPDAVDVAVPAALRDASIGPELWLVSRLPDVSDARVALVTEAMQIVGTAVAAWAAVSRLQAQNDAAARADALMQLLTSRGNPPAHVVEQSLALGWTLAGWHVGMCLRTTETLPHGHLSAREEQVQRAMHQAFPRAQIVRSGAGWLGWTTSRAEPSADEVSAAIDRLHGVVRLFGTRVVGGVATPRRGTKGLVDGLIEAQDLASAAGHVAGRRPVEDTRVTATRRLVLSAVSGSDVATGSEQVLRPLKELGEQRLLQTLETFLALESSRAETAAALHLHRNTIGKRLARIEQVLGVDLDDPEVRLALRIACRGRVE